MPAIKWAASKFWYEVGWRPFPTDSSTEPFLTKRVVPPQHQYVIPSPVMNMRYQYYVKAVNQQTEGRSKWIPIRVDMGEGAFFA